MLLQLYINTYLRATTGVRVCVCAGVGGQAKGHIQQSAREVERGADQLPLITTQTLPWHKKKAGESSHSPTFHGSLGMHIRCQERGRGVSCGWGKGY